ncbi:MAG: CvpA family protein [Burkholderiaceae bacterium]
MTLFDYSVVFVLTCSVLISLLRGLVKELLSLMSWVTALLVASAYCAPFAEMLPDAITDFVPGAIGRLIVAFVALFIVVKLLMALLGTAIDGVIKASGLVIVDRGLGGVFGLARGIVIVLAGVLACGMTAIPRQPFWKDAVLSPITEAAARAAIPFLPGAVTQHVKF